MGELIPEVILCKSVPDGVHLVNGHAGVVRIKSTEIGIPPTEAGITSTEGVKVHSISFCFFILEFH
jgi:hypothetical protein